MLFQEAKMECGAYNTMVVCIVWEFLALLRMSIVIIAAMHSVCHFLVCSFFSAVCRSSLSCCRHRRRRFVHVSDLSACLLDSAAISALPAVATAAT